MSQTKQILNHLRKGPINAMQALNDYGVFRLAARIEDLRKDGHDISTEIIKRGGKSYAVYSLKFKEELF